MFSFARQLAVEARERDPEGLERAHRVPVVHGEDVVGDSSELHDDVVRVAVVDDLKVFDARLSDAPVKVQDVRLRVVVPHGRLVVQFKNSLLKMKK